MSDFFNKDNLEKLGLMLSAVGSYHDPSAFSGGLNLFNTLQKVQNHDDAQRHTFSQNAAMASLSSPAANAEYSMVQPGHLTLNDDGSVNTYTPPGAPVTGNLLNEQSRMHLLSTALGGRSGPLG